MARQSPLLSSYKVLVASTEDGGLLGSFLNGIKMVLSILLFLGVCAFTAYVALLTMALLFASLQVLFNTLIPSTFLILQFLLSALLLLFCLQWMSEILAQQFCFHDPLIMALMEGITQELGQKQVATDSGEGMKTGPMPEEDTCGKSVGQEEEMSSTSPLTSSPKSTSSLHLVGSKVLRVVEQVTLLLAVLIYSIFLAEIVFHVMVSFSIPLSILRDHMVPTILIFLDALGPAAEVFYHDVVGALLLFLSALLLPLTAGCCLHLFLFPSYFKLLKLVW
ncbi:hypothetical protein JD844_026066 [Phrynosoma platyrhinos]|uniref:Transmembrane protein 245 n=1 Tax=Phrynosoma platyrhinos TaxID=52577 RepID=A0ABQ7SEF8_PHRPL|nr:hypothetical protein JD844_026066 [Phrynosoma platyrhinos]